MRERNYNYDLIRIFACLLIVCMHSPMPSDDANGIFLSCVSYFTAPGLCLFFVLSGSLLLPVTMSTKEFLKKRLGKVFAPTLVFTALYITLDYIEGADIDWTKTILSIPFSNQGNGILWFMYTLIGLYLLAPVLSRWLETVSKSELEFYLCLWGVTLFYPILKLFVDVDDGNSGMFFYFQGYAGYFILGHYLKKYPKSLSLKVMTLPTIIALAAPVACKVMHLEVDFYSVFWYLSIFVTILTVTMYKVFTIRKITITNTKVKNLVTKTSGLSFGIYLIHIAIMRNWLWKQEWITGINNHYLQWIAIVTITFAISWVVCYLISLLPFGAYIIGYRSTKTKSL